MASGPNKKYYKLPRGRKKMKDLFEEVLSDACIFIYLFGRSNPHESKRGAIKLGVIKAFVAVVDNY
jgi:hypothetical protein